MAPGTGVQTEWAARVVARAGGGAAAEVLALARAGGARRGRKGGDTAALGPHHAPAAEAAIHLEHDGTPRVHRCGWVVIAGDEVRASPPGAPGARLPLAGGPRSVGAGPPPVSLDAPQNA